MFGYYLDLAWRSLRRVPGLTLLMIVAVGFGVASAMTTYAVFRAVSGDPIPWKSSRLFVPQIDPWGPVPGGSDTEPPNALTYADAMALMHAHRARRESAIYAIAPSVLPAGSGRRLRVRGHAVYAAFFPMLDVPFKYGGGWSAGDDERRAAVAVLNGKLNRELFGGADSVGRTLRVDGKDYRVVGVLDDWNPQPRYYDTSNTDGFSADDEDLFLPFERGIAAGINNVGSSYCATPAKEAGFAGLLRSDCVWITYLAELDDAAATAAYRDYLDGYAREQQQAGRFHWPPNNRLRALPDWLDYQHVVPADTKVSLLVAVGLLIVCLVNTAGLLLAKFLRRSGEIGVRRALGAPRPAIYVQFLVEAALVGLAGGVLGLLLTWLGVACVGWVLPRDIAALARLDPVLLAGTLAVAILATLLAGLYPSYRAAQVQPALQLKAAR